MEQLMPFRDGHNHSILCQLRNKLSYFLHNREMFTSDHNLHFTPIVPKPPQSFQLPDLQDFLLL